ncbi:glycosyltransferase family 2 protein [Segetibacter koreensis]|uniref:glycosyltransferase family 2 protein n=1 Tax=Segetibacter koreensis TaxID=398037 RepID=UPI00037A4F67|nr:glycosyltransferase [Segetibacter koreensis]
MLPLVSICIPNYNKAEFITETIDSVFNQTYRNIEVIIIDDCSSDNSVEVIEKKIINAPFKVIFLKNTENRGICYSLNNAVKIAEGKYYQMIGSDDLILPNKISRQVETLEQLTEDYALVFGKPYRMDVHGNYLQKDYYQSIKVDVSSVETLGFEELLLKNFISSTSHLVRMNAIKEVGMYDETLRVEDWDLWLRLTKKFKFIFLNEYDSVYRIVPTSLTNNLKNFSSVYSTYCKTLLKHINYSATGNKNIAKNIALLALIVYKYNGENSKDLLRTNFLLNKNIKSLLLYLSAAVGIKYEYYSAVKSWRKNNFKL